MLFVIFSVFSLFCTISDICYVNNAIYLTVPITPPGSVNVVYSSTQATVTWSAVTGGSPGEEVTGYNLCLIEGSEEVCTLVSADTLSYTFALNPETAYTIRISAINANGEGPSSEVPFTTGNYV